MTNLDPSIYDRLISCEHDTRHVTRTEYDGSITVLADSYEGKRLNSPNDLAVTSDNSVWFTDPPFGIAGHYEGTKSPSEQPHQGVYRIDGKTGELTLVVAVFNPEGKMTGFIKTPERVANLVFGGAKRNRLFMTGSKSIYSLFTETVGAAPKFAK